MSEQENIYSMEMSDLKQEVIAALQRPFVKFYGLDSFQASKEWKAGIKKYYKKDAAARGRPYSDLKKAISYEVSEEVIDYLRPSVNKGSQRALYNAMLNAKPRHYNMWLEFFNPKQHQKPSLVGYHISALTNVPMLEGPKGRQYITPRLLPIKPGNVFTLDRYFEVKNSQHKLNKDRRKNAGLPPANHKINQLVGVSPNSTYTDIWSKEGPLIHNGEKNGLQIGSDSLVKKLWFLGDADGEFSPDMERAVSRWNQGLNNFIQDNEVNSSIYLDQAEEVHNYSWVVAIMSLMNFNWFVEEPISTGMQGSKTKKTNVTPYDSYHKVKLTVPKNKGMVVVPKQFKRIEPYGVREHDVAGHPRKYKDEYGVVYKVINISPHKRGNPKLGRVTKDYVVVKGDKNE